MSRFAENRQRQLDESCPTSACLLVLCKILDDKGTYDDAHPELTEFAERAAVFHIPLTTEARLL